jgi:hypothetical protein
MEDAAVPYIDTGARERIAELTGRLAAHERHCDERHNNLRDFMAHIERDTDAIYNRLSAIWRWIVGVLGLLIVTLLGLVSNIIVRFTMIGT